jgi:OOP family OmpA-OmpF porin
MNLFRKYNIKGLRMKKVIAGAILTTSILATSMLHAEVKNLRAYDLAGTFGATSIKNDSSIKLKDATFGINFQMNNYTVKPRFDFEYVRITDKDALINGLKADEVNSLLKASINGVYEMQDAEAFIPYALVGAGYEYVTDETKGFESHPFIQGGAGLGYRFQNNSFIIRLEARLLQILGGETIKSKSEDNEVITTLSFSVPFGRILNEEKKVEFIDSDGDGVMDRFDKCPDTPKGVRVDGSGCPLPEPKTEIIKEQVITSLEGNECPIKIDGPDRDRDGVEDEIDQCPNTPCDFSVDDKGCPVKANLMIHFETDKAYITDYSRPLVKKFADFLIKNKGSLVHIIGHTDWRGSDQYNMALSKRRAKAVRDALIEYGVSASRLSTEGRGEREPIASNKTKEGMALNRRTEVRLTYPQYIDAGEK